MITLLGHMTVLACGCLAAGYATFTSTLLPQRVPARVPWKAW
jgi:hypothetical protein